MIDEMTIYLGGDDPREQFLKFSSAMQDDRLLTMNELNVVSKLSYHDVHNEGDVFRQENGLKDIYFTFIDILYYRLNAGEYDEVVFADPINNKERIKVMINRLARQINLTNQLENPNTLVGNDSCILYATPDIIEKVAQRMQLLIEGLSIYVDKSSIPETKISKKSSPVLTVNKELDHPFVSEEQKKCFDYLAETFKLNQKSKWTYIYNGMKDEYGQRFDTSQVRFMNHVADQFGELSSRIILSAIKSHHIEEVEKLISQFKGGN